MTAALPGRTIALSAALVIIVVLQRATMLMVIACAARFGAPRAWPRVTWAVCVGVALLAALVVARLCGSRVP